MLDRVCFRKNRILDEAKSQIQEELRRQKEEEAEEVRRRKKADREMRMLIQKEIEDTSIQQLKENLQVYSLITMVTVIFSLKGT